MTLRIRLALVAAWTCLLAQLPAAVTVYTDRTAFLNAIGPSPYIETFDSTAPGPTPAPIEYSASGLVFDVRLKAPSFSSGLYPYVIPMGNPSDVIMACGDGRDTVVFDFSKANVYAVGAYFFCADFDGNVISADVFVDTDQTAPMTVPGGSTTAFLGFVSDVPFSNLTMIGDTTTVVAFASANDLILDYVPTAGGGSASGNKAPVVTVDGKKKVRTPKRKVILKGNATDDSAVSVVLVSYKKVTGSGKKKKVTKRAQLAGGAWKFKFRPTEKPTKLLIVAVDNEGLRSVIQKVKVIRKT